VRTSIIQRSGSHSAHGETDWNCYKTAPNRGDLFIVCNTEPRDQACALPDLKVAVVEHLLGLFNGVPIGITHYRARTRNLVANGQFINSVVVGGRHVQTYDTAKKEVEYQQKMDPIVLWEKSSEPRFTTTSRRTDPSCRFPGENLPFPPTSLSSTEFTATHASRGC